MQHSTKRTCSLIEKERKGREPLFELDNSMHSKMSKKL
uniref:Uncharacterized protein n=1 Tax=Anguilla anguilla TaxID=7936 RepID=A0A0E9WA97_ANGAN